MQTFDVTQQTFEVLGRAGALSAGLGAAAARTSGLAAEDNLIAAMREEFGHLDMPAGDIEKDIQIGRNVFAALTAVDMQPVHAAAADKIASITYSDCIRGTPSILEAGNAAMRQTGTWRVERPVIDGDVCTRCGLCFVQCPDGAIALDEEGYPVITFGALGGATIHAGNKRVPVRTVLR